MTASPFRPLKISDVAKHAGVSLSTVSRVMNGNPTVDADLARRVRESVAELGYTASPLARGLVLGKTQTVAIVVPDLANPTFQQILHGFNRAALRAGYHVLIADSEEDAAEESILAVETRRRTDAVVLCAPRMPEDQLVALLPTLAPVVVVNRDPRVDVPVVAADYRSALLEIIDHLYGLGHRRILYLGGIPSSTSNASRLAALEGFRGSHGDVVIDERHCGVGFADGAAAVQTVLASECTAVLAYNDLVAMGLLSGLHEAGVEVPGELSVAGFDDIPFARYTTPPLTTASVPAAEMGAQTWISLERLLNNGEAGHAMYFRPRLQVRGSTGPAPR